MAPLPRPGNSPSFSLNSGSDSVLKTHPYFLSWGGGRGEEGMYYNSQLYNAMQFTKPLHFHQLPWTPRVPRERGIQWFIKLLPGPTTRYQALGLATHQGRVGRSLPGAGAEDQAAGQFHVQSSFPKARLGSNASPSGGARPSTAARPGPPPCSQRSSRHLLRRKPLPSKLSPPPSGRG